MSSPARARRMSSAEEVCPICLCAMDEQFSRPENCQHRFDLDCLTEWSKLRLSCPSCRAQFGAIYTYEIVEEKPKLIKVQKMEPPKEAEPFDETNPLDFTNCEICGEGHHEELLLICDQCDRGFHTFCLTPPLDGVPTTEQWFCPQCEETRSSLPSTSRAPPSARTIRLVQRTALAERVRRLLERNRRLESSISESEESSELESEADDEEVEDEVAEDVVEGEEEEELTASSEEEGEIPEFFDDDARVLAEIGEGSDDEPALPSVKRRSKKQREAAAKKKKVTTTKRTKKRTVKRTTKGKKRKTKRRRRTRRTKHAEGKNGPMDAFVLRRGGAHDPIARLSLLGAGLEPVADEDCLVTENSRRFDRPLLRRRDESSSFRNEEVEEEKPTVDSCDLLGSILPEQVKTLAPGRLFAIGGGRFNTTDDFEKYKERKTNQLSSELKQRLGIPVNKNASFEETYASKSKDISKERTGRDSTQIYPELRDRPVTSLTSKKNSENITQPNSLKDYRDSGSETTRRDGWRNSLRTIDEENGSRARYSQSKLRDRRYDHSTDGGSRSERALSDNQESADIRSESKPLDRTIDGKSERRETERSREVDRHNVREGPNQSNRAYRKDNAGRNYERPREASRQFNSVRNELDPQLCSRGFRGEMGNNDHERIREDRRNEQKREEGRRNNNSTSEKYCRDSKGSSNDRIREENKKNNSSKSKSQCEDRNCDYEKGRKYTYQGRREEHREERSRNSTIKAPGSGHHNRGISERPYTIDKSYNLSEKFRQETSSQTPSRSDRSHQQQRDESITRRNTPLRDLRKMEESEQEDKVAVKKHTSSERRDKEVFKGASAIKEVAPGPSSSKMLKESPDLAKTSSTSWNKKPEDKHKHKHNVSDGSDRVKIIDTLAKEAIRHYKRSLSVDEYKDVMRAVVRECYKKKILEGDKVKEKVDEYVRAVRNGEKLDIGHHGAKRSKSSSGDSAVPPKKRQKV